MSEPHASVEIRHLRYFLAVMEEKHFGRAAARLHIAQPPLSHAIRRLERELGVTLFERTSRSVSPTEAGIAFAEHARTVLRGLDYAVAAARRAGSDLSMLRVGCVPSIPIGRVQRFMTGIQDVLPGIVTRVTHVLAPDLVEGLHTGELDLGVLHQGASHDGIEMAPLFPGEPLVARVCADAPVAAISPLRPPDLEGETLVTFPRHADPDLHDHLLTTTRQRGFRFGRVLETPGTDPRDVTLAVAQGLGVALEAGCAQDVVEPVSTVVRRPLEPQLRMPDTAVAWHPEPPAVLAQMLESVRRLAHALHESSTAPIQ